MATAPSTPGGPPRRFLLALRSGTVAAEAFLGPDGFSLVRRSGGPTFVRAAGAQCWRPQSRRSPRNFINVGAPFPENGKIILAGEQTHGSGTPAKQLIIETADGFWGYLASPVMPSGTYYKSFLTVTFNPASHVIRSIVVRAPDHAVHVVQTVRPLETAPAMPHPLPAC